MKRTCSIQSHQAVEGIYNERGQARFLLQERLQRAEGNKQWYFNSSIAEQTNVWLGGYHAICREMLVDKYNFFLDEMILRRNIMTKDKLTKEGSIPGNWPTL